MRRKGRLLFVWRLCTQSEGRELKKTLAPLMIPLIIAIVVDAIVQYMLFQRLITHRIASARTQPPLETRPSRG